MGCEFCKLDGSNNIAIIGGVNRTIQTDCGTAIADITADVQIGLLNDEHYIIAVSGINDDWQTRNIKIHYCPFCGRDFSDE